MVGKCDEKSSMARSDGRINRCWRLQQRQIAPPINSTAAARIGRKIVIVARNVEKIDS
jgi:hypothetical protein